MMRLERLELNGFKSFSSSTEFVFGPGITAVVGPNGCGKSNIADALNWVIGEQSTRSLRAEHMGDVIFNGSEMSRPLGMAEVTLHLASPFDDADGNGGGPAGASVAGSDDGGAAAAEAGGNGDGHPAPVSDARSIAVTRRLFRSGESEYLIDGKRCRLRDVQELLAEVRVGSGVYAVIEQGRVDAVLSSRPRERRILIEEAAGIALYKVRKRQAQLKLEATEANLLRINDLVGEIERQIGSLKRQAARARRYARLTEAIDRSERILFHHESLRLEEAASEIRSRRVALEDREAEAAAGVGRAEAALHEARELLALEEERHRQVREALHGLDRAIDALRQSVDRWREQESQAVSQIARGESESALLARRIEDHEACAIVLSDQLEAVERESDRCEAAASEMEVVLRLDATALQATETVLAAAREALASESGDLSDRRNEMLRLRDALSRAGVEQDRLDRLSLEMESEHASLAARRSDHLAALEAARSGLEAARTEAEEAAKDRATEESRREAHLLEREERRGRLAALEERIAALRAIDAATATDALAVEDGAALPFLKDLIRSPENLDRAVDAALRDLLHGRLTESTEQSASIVSALKSRGRGRAVLLPRGGARGLLDDPDPAAPAPGILGTLRDLLVPHGEDLPFLRSILGRILVAEDLSAAIAARSLRPGFDVVTLQGDFLSRDGWIEGGAELPEEAGVMTLKRLFEKLSADLPSARRRIEELDAAVEDAASRIAALKMAEEGSRRREAECARESEALRLRGEALEDEWRKLALRNEAQSGDRGRLGEDLADLKHHLAARTRLFEEGLGRQDELMRSAEALSAEIDFLRAILRLRSEAVSARREAVASARERRAALLSEVRHQDEALSDLRRRHQRESEEGKRWRAQREEARARLAEDGRAMADRMAERIVADGEWVSAEGALAERRQSLSALEGKERETRRALEEVRDHLHGIAIEEERLAGDRRGLEARSAERGWPSLAVATAGLTEEEQARDPESARSELSELKAHRDTMGPVNLMAMEQYRELEERFVFITTQRRDLEESIRSLKETIARINRQSRERFVEAFEKIRSAFSEVFKTLFGGGRADLRLAIDPESEDDILEAGLEIIAQPPGKRLQSISLLSGGEKALTAIALLFAIFRYSPSPFCLLDEVDAPLDEANVMRFNDLLRSMAEETQFIVITHNRRTMEAADVLYGITMEEPGVSRSVSVVMGTEEARREAARTLPEMLRSRHRGNGRGTRVPPRPAPVAPPADA